MSLLIKGMELPKFGEKIIILTSSGYIEDVSGQVIEGVEVISVPTPHGRLGDLNKLINHIDDKYWDSIWIKSTALSMIEQEIRNAPTVIEAEKSK